MYIHEAIKARTADKPYIARKAWSEENNPRWYWDVKIRPTNSPDCCIYESYYSKNRLRGWQPRADDLCADDWYTRS